MNLDAQVTKFVTRKDMVIPIKTLKAAKKDEYAFMRISDMYYLCQHGDKAYVIGTVGARIGCSCPAMTYHCKDNDVCKHIAALIGLSELPHKPITDAIGIDLIGAGWTGVMGDLQPPDETTVSPVIAGGVHIFDELGQEVYDAEKPEPDTAPPFGTKTYDRECPYCREVHSEVSHEEADAWLKGHMQDCSKNPKNKEMQDMKTKTPPNDEDPHPTPATGTKPPTPPDTSLDADVRSVIGEAEGFGAKDIDPAYVHEKLAAMAKYKVAPEDAHTGVVNSILRIQCIKRPKTSGGANQLVTIDTIDAPGKWINLRVKVTQLWDSDHESIRQIGLVGDETGVIKFVSWEKAGLDHIDADKCYSIDNVVTNEYDGTYSVTFTKNTKISEIPEDIEVGFVEKTVSGVLVAIQNGSGFITRCPTCNKSMRGGECDEHGKSQGIPDLRLKFVMDDGMATENVLLNREMTEKITGITLDEAKTMATEAFDANVVSERMAEMLVGREFDIIGQAVGSTTLATDVRTVDISPTKQEIEALMTEV